MTVYEHKEGELVVRIYPNYAILRDKKVDLFFTDAKLLVDYIQFYDNGSVIGEIKADLISPRMREILLNIARRLKGT